MPVADLIPCHLERASPRTSRRVPTFHEGASRERPPRIFGGPFDSVASEATSLKVTRARRDACCPLSLQPLFGRGGVHSLPCRHRHDPPPRSRSRSRSRIRDSNRISQPRHDQGQDPRQQSGVASVITISGRDARCHYARQGSDCGPGFVHGRAARMAAPQLQCRIVEQASSLLVFLPLSALICALCGFSGCGAFTPRTCRRGINAPRPPPLPAGGP